MEIKNNKYRNKSDTNWRALKHNTEQYPRGETGIRQRNPHRHVSSEFNKV